MTNDRELLELAAKAAGYDYITETEGDVFAWKSRDCIEWNPLTNDGDALRLAVKLRMDLMFYSTTKGAFVKGKQHAEEEDNDPYAAARRAIVRAAAEIGSNHETT